MKTLTNITSPAFAVLTIACFALSPVAQAVGPDTEGAIPFANNGEGKGVLVNRTSGVWNTGTGYQALNQLTSGNQNTATGLRALFTTTTGFYNTATGVYSLFNNVDGRANTADGWQSLVSNTSGFGNVAMGAQALSRNTDGSLNTAVGTSALENSTNFYNTAIGAYALKQNTTGFENVAVGHLALESNTDGGENTAVGDEALRHNTTGGVNTANGWFALLRNTTGDFNTATGSIALFDNTEGLQNTANGGRALQSNTTGDNNTALGFSAGYNLTTGNGNVCIGAGILGIAGESNTTRIRNIYQTVQPVVGTDPDYVTINNSGRLGRANVSSRRYKHDVKPMEKASELLFALKPVSFRYNKEYDTTQTIAFGLIAEDVADVYPDLVGRNAEGQPESVRYEQINAMLLNEFLKEHRTVQEQQKEIDALRAELKEQRALIQKVSDKVELSRPAPQTVLNNQ